MKATVVTLSPRKRFDSNRTVIILLYYQQCAHGNRYRESYNQPNRIVALQYSYQERLCDTDFQTKLPLLQLYIILHDKYIKLQEVLYTSNTTKKILTTITEFLIIIYVSLPCFTTIGFVCLSLRIC